jgi:predicted HAD superfamily Cof-like phosphohydrolase
MEGILVSNALAMGRAHNALPGGAESKEAKEESEGEVNQDKEGYDAAEAVYMRATLESNIPNLQQDVRQFMAIAGQAIPERPQWPDQETMDLRVRLISEEYMETISSMGYNVFVGVSNLDGCWVYEKEFTQAHLNYPNMPETADGLIDLLYVTVGSLLAMGIDMWPLWVEVQRANMAKLGGPVIDGKLMKPER